MTVTVLSPRTTNRKAPKKRRATSRRKKRQPVETVLMAVTGIAIPVVTVSLTGGAGHVLEVSPELAAALGVTAVCMLAVSMDHLAHAIGRLTRAAPWRCWAIAGALDCSIVLAELAQVLDPSMALWSWCMLGGIGALSICLNVWSLLRN